MRTVKYWPNVSPVRNPTISEIIGSRKMKECKMSSMSVGISTIYILLSECTLDLGNSFVFLEISST